MEKMKKAILLTVLTLLSSFQVNLVSAITLESDEIQKNDINIEESILMESQGEEINDSSEEPIEEKAVEEHSGIFTEVEAPEIDEVIKEENEEIKEEPAEPTNITESPIEGSKVLSNSFKYPTVNLDTIKFSKYDVIPGDIVTVSMEVYSDTPVQEVEVSFVDLNNIGPKTLLTYNTDTTRYEGTILIEDNLRVGELSLISIIARNNLGNSYYYDHTLGKTYGSYDLSSSKLNVSGSHGPYIDITTIKFDDFVHPNKTPNLTFKIVNPQYIIPKDNIFFVANFKGPIPVNSSKVDSYRNRLIMDENGNVTSNGDYNNVLYEKTDGVYSLDEIVLPIYDVNKTKEQYKANVNIERDISFAYEKYYSADSIINIDTVRMNRSKYIEKDVYIITAEAKKQASNGDYISVHYKGTKTGKEFSVSLKFDSETGRFSSNQYVYTAIPDQYVVQKIVQNYDGKTEYVYNSTVSQHGKVSLDKFNHEVVSLNTIVPSTSEKEVSYSARIKNEKYRLYDKPFGKGDLTVNYFYNNSEGRLAGVSNEVTNEFGTWVYITYLQFERGWVNKDAIERIEIIESKDTSYIATVSDFVDIYDKPFGLDGAYRIAESRLYAYQQVEVVNETKTNYSTSALIKLNGKTLGWIDIKALKELTVIEDSAVDKTQLINKAWSINTKPWGLSGFELVASGSQYLGNVVKVVQEQVTDRSRYSLIQVDGKEIGWIDSDALRDPHVIFEEKDTNYSATVIKPWSINTQPWGTMGSKSAVINNFIGKEVTISQEKTTDKGTYALIYLNKNKLGWIDVTGLRPLTVKSTKTVNYNGIITKEWSINDKPWGTKDFKQVQVGSKYLGKEVKVTQEKTTQRGIYALIQINGKNIGWIDKGAVKEKLIVVKSTKNINYAAKVIKPWSINSQPWGTKGYKLVADGKKYINKEVVITQEKVTEKGTYALISVNGKRIGWIDKSGISPYKVMKQKKVSYTAIITKRWSINTQPWGVSNYKAVSNQSAYWGQKVRVLQEKTTSRGTYGYIQYSKKNIGWIDLGALKRN